MERALEEKKQALLDVQKMSKDVQEAVEAKDVNKDENVSVSTINTQSVGLSVIMSATLHIDYISDKL